MLNDMCWKKRKERTFIYALCNNIVGQCLRYFFVVNDQQNQNHVWII